MRKPKLRGFSIHTGSINRPQSGDASQFFSDNSALSVAPMMQGGERPQGILVASCMVLWTGKDNLEKYPEPQNLENDPHIGFVDQTSSNSRSDRFL